jgi:hypothetical protein
VAPTHNIHRQSRELWPPAAVLPESPGTPEVPRQHYRSARRPLCPQKGPVGRLKRGVCISTGHRRSACTLSQRADRARCPPFPRRTPSRPLPPRVPGRRHEHPTSGQTPKPASGLLPRADQPSPVGKTESTSHTVQGSIGGIASPDEGVLAGRPPLARLITVGPPQGALDRPGGTPAGRPWGGRPHSGSTDGEIGGTRSDVFSSRHANSDVD